MSAILSCPNGHTVESERRGRHMPICLRCAAEGRGHVPVTVETPPPPPERTEAPEHVRVHEPAPALTATAGYKHDCERDGHLFTGDRCAFCPVRTPANPAARIVAAAALAFALVTALVPRCAHAEEWKPPTGCDVAMLAAAETLVVVDVWQTLDLKNHPEFVFGELNPLLGSHPSDARIIGTAAAGAIVTGALWYALPPEGRWVVPVVVVILETFAIVNNARAGLVVRF